MLRLQRTGRRATAVRLAWAKMIDTSRSLTLHTVRKWQRPNRLDKGQDDRTTVWPEIADRSPNG